MKTIHTNFEGVLEAIWPRALNGPVEIRARKENTMKKTALLCVLVLAMAIPALPAGESNNQAKIVPRAVNGVMDGRFAFDGPWEGPWTVTGDLSGTLRHLGLSGMYTSHTTSPVGFITDGAFTIEAANGDIIQGTYTASAEMISEDQVLGTATLSIMGGTGRVACATGMINASFLETLDDPNYASAKVTWNLAGTIYY
jgi:hypothetical protein